MPNSVNSDYRFGLHPLTRLLHSRVRRCCSLKRSEYTLYSEVDFVLVPLVSRYVAMPATVGSLVRDFSHAPLLFLS
jgi:hypothetical protein